MAGLLGSIFNTQEGRMGLGLLALGQAPRSQAMPGLLSLMNSMDVAEQRKAESAWANTQRERQQKEWAAKDAAAQRDAEIQAAIPGLFGSTSQGSVSIPDVGGVPFVSQEGAQVDQPSIRSNSGFDVQRALQWGMSPEQIQKYYELSNLGRQEVARTVEGMENGRPVTLQYDKYGQPVGRGVEQWKAPVQVNRGDRVDFVSPVTLQQQGSFGVNMSPSERDASARGWAGNNLAQQRLAMDKANSGDNGYTFNAQLGGYVPKTPGGQFVPLGGVPAGGQKLTESEAKHSLYLGQMREASAELAGPKARGAGPVGVAMTGSPITNWAAPEAAQIAGQAQRQWAEAYLRAKTGAAATAGEVENNIRTYFPVVGDDAATVKRKNIARAAAERDMELPAGRGVGRVGGAQGSWDAPPAASGGVQREFSMLPNAAQFDGKRMRAPDGTVYRSRNGQWAKE